MNDLYMVNTFRYTCKCKKNEEKLTYLSPVIKNTVNKKQQF